MIQKRDFSPTETTELYSETKTQRGEHSFKFKGVFREKANLHLYIRYHFPQTANVLYQLHRR